MSFLSFCSFPAACAQCALSKAAKCKQLASLSVSHKQCLLRRLNMLHGVTGTNEAAAALLALADESGLTKLRAVCLDYIVHHYTAVAATEAYKSLTSHQRDLIAAESCALYAHLRSLLREVTARKKLS